MCGRFHLTKSRDEVARAIRAVDLLAPGHEGDALFGRFNIAPSQAVAIVTLGQHPDPAVPRAHLVRTMIAARWGFTPAWNGPSRKAVRPINARSDSLHAARMFAAAARGRRCIVPATGWFEWQATPDGKVPHAIGVVGQSGGRGLLAFAGIFEPANQHTGGLPSVAIVTVDASSGLSRIHDRMPAILSARDIDGWLDPRTPLVDASKALVPRGSEIPLAAYEVSTLVNRPENDSPKCIAPVG